MVNFPSSRIYHYVKLHKHLKAAKISRLELAAASLFWLLCPGATAILASYLSYRLASSTQQFDLTVSK